MTPHGFVPGLYLSKSVSTLNDKFMRQSVGLAVSTDMAFQMLSPTRQEYAAF